MENRQGEVHVTTDEARSGSTPHVVRWVLAISLLAAIVLLSAMWMTSAALQDDTAPSSTKQPGVVQTGTAQNGDQNSTDSMVGDRVRQAPE